jgi:hypothetical protein
MMLFLISMIRDKNRERGKDKNRERGKGITQRNIIARIRDSIILLSIYSN